VSNILPARSGVDHLASVVEEFVLSSHQRHTHERDTGRSTELPDPSVDLDISTLPEQIRDQILLNQHPNFFHLRWAFPTFLLPLTFFRG